MLRINHILLLLIFLASHMDSQHIALWLCSFLPAPPQDHEPTISFTISLPICEPIFVSPTSYRNSPMGPPPFINFPSNFFSPWGTHFTLGHPFLYFVHISHIYSLFIVQTHFSCLYFFHHCWRPTFLLGHTQPMSPLVGALLLIYLADIVYIFRVLLRSLTFIL
jgi:hypothetical protein